MVKNIAPIILVCIFAFIAGFSLLHQGLIPTHDGEYHIARFYEFDKVLKEGNLYPRWAPDFNKSYGIPLFNFVYPLPNYAASAFHLFGVSFIDAFKLQMFFALIAGAIFFYLWSREFWGNSGGIISSVFYTFSPYHFVDIYIRGSVGEVWALAFFPALLWSLISFIKNRRRTFFLLSSVFLSLVIFSHNILALMLVPFAIIYVAFLILNEKKDKKKLVIGNLCVVLLGLSLSAVFWLPALFEKNYTLGLKIFDFSSHFPELYQLIIPSWGSGFSGGNLQNQMSFQIGLMNLLAIFVSGIIAIFLMFKKDKNARTIIFFVFWAFLVVFLMLKTSLAVWENLPLMNYFQFPWRFLSLEIIVASFLAGSIVYFWKSKISVVVLVLLVFIFGIYYAKPAYYLNRSDNFYIDNPVFIDGTNSATNAFNTIWMDYSIAKQEKKMVLEGKGVIKQRSAKSGLYVFDVDAEENIKALVGTAYFPGWKARVDRKKTDITITKNGLFSFNIPKGKHDIEIKFEDTLVRKLANIISLLGLVPVFILFTKRIFATIRQ